MGTIVDVHGPNGETERATTEKVDTVEATPPADAARPVDIERRAGIGKPGEIATVRPRSSDVVAGGSSVAQGVAGAGAIVLAILGLAGILPFYMAAIATIAVGAALLFQGGSLAARYSRILHETSQGEVRASELGGGMSAQTMAGAAGVALGILALLGVLPMILMPIAVIIFGGGLLIGSGTASRLNDAVLDWRTSSDHARRIAREAASSSAGAHVLVGVSVLVLGVLALLGVEPLALTLVALLGLGVSVLMSGSTMGAKMLGFLHH